MEDIIKRITLLENEINNLKGGINLNDVKIGDVITMQFQDVTIALRKIGYNVYEVVDKGESIKIKEDDLIRIKDEDSVIKPGEKINLEILRKALDYKTDNVVRVN